MTRLDFWFGRAAESVSLLGMIAVVLLVLHISIDVMLRAVFNLPIGSTIMAVSLYYMPMIVFLPLAFTETRSGHISVELVYDLLPRWAQYIGDFLSHAITITVFVALCIRCWGEAMSKYNIGAAEMEGRLRIVTWPSYYVLPVGFALLVAIVVYRLICLLRRHEPKFGTEQWVDVVEETHSV